MAMSGSICEVSPEDHEGGPNNNEAAEAVVGTNVTDLEDTICRYKTIPQLTQLNVEASVFAVQRGVRRDGNLELVAAVRDVVIGEVVRHQAHAPGPVQRLFDEKRGVLQEQIAPVVPS